MYSILSRASFLIPLISITLVQATDTVPRLRYNTCDLDLSPEVLNQLPEECLTVESPLKDKLLEESLKFKEFWSKLESYEAETDSDYQKIKETDHFAAAVPQKDWDLRHTIYEQVDLLLCQNGTEVTYEQFVDCMIAQRGVMNQLFDSEVARRKVSPGP